MKIEVPCSYSGSSVEIADDLKKSVDRKIVSDNFSGQTLENLDSVVIELVERLTHSIARQKRFILHATPTLAD
jgi:hypothetical protein